jgi:hypothetical protein
VALPHDLLDEPSVSKKGSAVGFSLESRMGLEGLRPPRFPRGSLADYAYGLSAARAFRTNRREPLARRAQAVVERGRQRRPA